MPLSGMVCHRHAGLLRFAMFNLHTKFEISNFTRYEDMKGVAKCRKRGGFGRLGVTQDYWQCHHSIERMRLPIRL